LFSLGIILIRESEFGKNRWWTPTWIVFVLLLCHEKETSVTNFQNKSFFGRRRSVSDSGDSDQHEFWPAPAQPPAPAISTTSGVAATQRHIHVWRSQPQSHLWVRHQQPISGRSTSGTPSKRPSTSASRSSSSASGPPANSRSARERTEASLAYGSISDSLVTHQLRVLAPKWPRPRCPTQSIWRVTLAAIL